MSDDFGDIVHGMFLDPIAVNGQVIHGYSDICSFEDLVSTFEKTSGRKSRFRPLPSWEAFDTFGIPELDDTKPMLGFTQNSQGQYFSPESSEKDASGKLKFKTAVALGRLGDAQHLMTVERWFQKHFLSQ
jgi:hypothetical protein